MYRFIVKKKGCTWITSHWLWKKLDLLTFSLRLVLVVSALKAISNEQIEELNDLGITATEVGINDQEDKKIFSLLFLSSQLHFLGICAVLDLHR